MHDSEKTIRRIVEAAYESALRYGGTKLGAMIAESFVDSNGYPLLIERT